MLRRSADFVGFVTERGGISVVLPTNHLDVQAFRPDGELLNRGSAESIGRGKKDGVTIALEVMRELGGRSGFAGAIDANDKDGFGLGGEGTDWRGWIGRTRRISSRATSATSRAVIFWLCPRFCRAATMRRLIGTPRSLRMSISSSSSQSTGFPVNFSASDLKNFMA